MRLRVTQSAGRNHLESAFSGHRVLPLTAFFHGQRLAVPAQHHRRWFPVAADRPDLETVAEPGGAVVPFDVQPPVGLGGGEGGLHRKRVRLVDGGQLASQAHAVRRVVHRRQGVHPQAQLLAPHGERQPQRRQAIVDPGQPLGEQRQGQRPAPLQRPVGADFQTVAGGENRVETGFRLQARHPLGGGFQRLFADHWVGEAHHQGRAGAHLAGWPAVQVAAPAAVHGRGALTLVGRRRRWRGSLRAGGCRAGFLGDIAGQQGEGQKQHA